MIYLILFLGFILRLINLNQSLWLDESIEVLAVKNFSYLNLITKYSLGDFHPPLYHIILKFWNQFFGFSEISSRFPSIIFGLLTCYFIYLIGRKLFDEKTGRLAALFLVINPLAIYYSQEARMYSLAMFAIAAAFYFFLTKKWPYYLFFFLVALYTDYLPWLMFPVFLLLGSKNRRFFIFYLLFFILLLPWFPFLWQQLHIGTSVAANNPLWRQVVGGFSLKDLPLTFVKFIIGRISLDNKILYAVLITPVAAVYLWLMSRVKEKTLWLWLTIPLILGLIISLKIPVFSYFRFLFVLPAFCLILAKGAENNKFLISFVILINVLSLLIFNLNTKFQRENWRAAVSYMEDAGNVIIMPSLAQAAPIYYYESRNLRVIDKNNLSVGADSPVFLVRYVQEIFDPQDSERKFLEMVGYKKTEERSFNGVLIWKYTL